MSGLRDNEDSYRELKRKVRDLADDTSEYNESNKKEFGEALNQHLDALREKNRQLEQCAEDLEEVAAEQLRQIVKKLEIKLEMFATKMSATQAQTDEGWLEMKRGLIQAWKSLTLSIENEDQKYQKVCNDE